MLTSVGWASEKQTAFRSYGDLIQTMATEVGATVLDDMAGAPQPKAAVLLIVGEPFSEDDKTSILAEITKGFRAWDCDASGVDINDELAQIANRASLGDEGPNGERLIRHSSDNVAVEILINPQAASVKKSLRGILTQLSPIKMVIFAGYAIQGSASWVLQDDTFTCSNFNQLFKDPDVENAIKQVEGASLVIRTVGGSDWTSALKGSDITRQLKTSVNPEDKLHNIHGVLQFTAYVQNFIKPVPLTNILQSSDVIGNISFTRPVLYIFPSCQGDSALFGMKGFNMLINGGYSRRSSFFDFARHLDGLDALLLTHLGSDNLFGIKALLERKNLENIHPEINWMFMNHGKAAVTNGDAGGGKGEESGLLINLVAEGNRLLELSKQFHHVPQTLSRPLSGNLEPINLYHKHGMGSLDMYVLNPVADCKEMKDFLAQWGKQSASFSSANGIPIPDLTSISALLVVRPASANENVTRILFPGNAPQHKLLEGLERVKNLEFLKHPTFCTHDLHKPKKAPGVGNGRAASATKRTAPVTKAAAAPTKAEPPKRLDTKSAAPKSTPTAPASAKAAKLRKEDNNNKRLSSVHNKEKVKLDEKEKEDKSKSSKSSTSSSPSKASVKTASPVKTPSSPVKTPATSTPEDAPPPTAAPEPVAEPPQNHLDDIPVQVPPANFTAQDLLEPVPAADNRDESPEALPEPTQHGSDVDSFPQQAAVVKTEKERLQELGVYDDDDDEAENGYDDKENGFMQGGGSQDGEDDLMQPQSLPEPVAAVSTPSSAGPDLIQDTMDKFPAQGQPLPDLEPSKPVEEPAFEPEVQKPTETAFQPEPVDSGFDQQPAGMGFDQPAGMGFDQPAGMKFDQQPAGMEFDQQPAGMGFDQQPAGMGFDQQTAGMGFDQQTAGMGFDQQTAGMGFDQQPAGMGFEPEHVKQEPEPEPEPAEQEPEPAEQESEPAKREPEPADLVSESQLNDADNGLMAEPEEAGFDKELVQTAEAEEDVVPQGGPAEAEEPEAGVPPFPEPKSEEQPDFGFTDEVKEQVPTFEEPSFTEEAQETADSNAFEQKIEYGITNDSGFQMGGIREEEEEEELAGEGEEQQDEGQPQAVPADKPELDKFAKEELGIYDDEQEEEEKEEEDAGDDDKDVYVYEKDVNLEDEEVHRGGPEEQHFGEEEQAYDQGQEEEEEAHGFEADDGPQEEPDHQQVSSIPEAFEKDETPTPLESGSVEDKEGEEPASFDKGEQQPAGEEDSGREDTDSIDGGTPDDEKDIDEVLAMQQQQMQASMIGQDLEEAVDSQMMGDHGDGPSGSQGFNPFIGLEGQSAGMAPSTDPFQQSPGEPDELDSTFPRGVQGPDEFDPLAQWGHPTGLPSPAPPQELQEVGDDSMHEDQAPPAEQAQALEDQDFTQQPHLGKDLDEEEDELKEFDPAAEWGQPMGLPSPPPPEADTKATGKNAAGDAKKAEPKKPSTPRAKASEKRPPSATKSPTKPANGSADSPASKSKDTARTTRPSTAPTRKPPATKDSKPRPNTAQRPATATSNSRASPSTTKMPPLPPMTPFYVDLTYIPAHGNPTYCDIEFFKRVRARYYVLSTLSPNPSVLQALMDAKTTWDKGSEQEVTLIPTYETDVLRHWMALHKDELAQLKIDVAPAASRCTVRLQDHEDSCFTYRLEF